MPLPLSERTFPGAQRIANWTKMATNRKVEQMVQHALELHCDTSALPRELTTNHECALLKFQTKLNDSETIGGIFWAWKMVYLKILI